MVRVVIFTGGSLGDWALRRVRPGDVLVGADRGALFLVRAGYTPDLAIGDFDSVNAEEREQIRRTSKTFVACDPVAKDRTDTEMAFDWALERRPERIVVLGALGTRFDHSLANVHLLRKGISHGVDCAVADRHNEIRLVAPSRPAVLEKGEYTHVSLLPLSLDVHGVTLAGFQYPLDDAELTVGQSLGVSNVLLEPEGRVSVREGLLLVIQSRE